MSTFAETLVNRIRETGQFWADVESVASIAIGRLLPGIRREQPVIDDSFAIGRLLQSASAFSQTDSDSDKALAQDLALFSALASDSHDTKSLAKDILCTLGNIPGADRLSAQFEIKPPSFTSHLRYSLLKVLNTVPIDNRDQALTDFQMSVWSSLPKTDVGAISAPTSAGKSFVVVEYLCQQAIAAQRFTAVFIAPTRALLGEIHGKISRRLKEYSQSTRISTIPTIDSEGRPKQIFVLTQERLQVLLNTWDGVFDLIIVDEAQSIGDDSRGMILQDCLEATRTRSDSTRFLFLAPGATGFEALTLAVGFPRIEVTETRLSPVVQNRISVEPVAGQPHMLSLTLLKNERTFPIGTFSGKRGFAHPETRLAAVALELGRTGGSLVYGTGPANAEKVAGQIASALPKSTRPELTELSNFIKSHIHPKYSVVKHVLKGVGVHYGKMPSLLRESIEEAFKNEHLKYLVCTTTLFQGVNLPARNVFIDTPTRGKGDQLEPAAIWNFAGRAGRLSQDIVGNVFLVGYDSWEFKPLTNQPYFSITPSFRKTIASQRLDVLARLKGNGLEETPGDLSTATNTAAGLLISKAANGTVSDFVSRTIGDFLSVEERSELILEAKNAYSNLGLPADSLSINWTVNPFGQARLLKRFREKISLGESDELIPLHPFPKSKTVRSQYVGIFSRINKYILGKNSSRFANKLTSLSLEWMRGAPLPVIIKSAIRYVERDGAKANYDSVIRSVFVFIEDLLRFRYVQLGRAYVDLLRYALNEAQMESKARAVYDFPLALELGVSSVAGQAFIELGLSRISASALENLIPDSNPSVEQARQWLSGLSDEEFKLSRMIWGDLVRNELVSINPTKGLPPDDTELTNKITF